jgi:TPP-dependent pyruvate/acetoin dehydrogenase alpha subunit
MTSSTISAECGFSTKCSKKAALSKEDLIKFENMVAEMFRSKQIRVPIHLSGGNEDELIAIFKKIKASDYVFSTWRNHYHYLLKGGRPEQLLANIVFSDLGSMHTIDPDINFYSSAIVAGTVAIAAGVALAFKIGGHKRHVWCFLGDGCCDEGWYWEAKHYAEANNLPISYIIEDNDRAVCSSKSQRYCYRAKWPHAGVGEFVAL